MKGGLVLAAIAVLLLVCALGSSAQSRPGRILLPLAPREPPSTATSTPTPIPTATPSATLPPAVGTAVAATQTAAAEQTAIVDILTATAAARNTATPTVIASPTGTPSPLAQATIQIGSVQASSENPGNNAAFAADGNSATFWRPVANQSPAFVQANFSSAQTVQGVRILTAMGDAIATATATVGPTTPTATPNGANYRVVLLKPSLVGAASARSAQDVDCNFQFAAQDNATIQLLCSETSSVTGVRVYVDSPGNPALPPGVRELVVYPPAVATATPTPTVTPTLTTCPGDVCTVTVTATATVCPAPTCTVTPTLTGTACPVPTCTVTPTQTTTATPSSTTTPTFTATPTATATATPPACDPARSGSCPGITVLYGDSGNAAGQGASLAVDNDLNTYWQADAPPGASGSEEWRVQYSPAATIGQVNVRLFQQAASSGTVTLVLTNSAAVPTVTSRQIWSGALSGYQDATPVSFTPALGSIARVQIVFSGLTTAPGIANVAMSNQAPGP